MNKLQHLVHRASAVLLIALLTAGLSGTRPATAASASSTSRIFLSNADAYVTSSSPMANYGALTALRADSSPVTHSYLRFAVQGLGRLHIIRARLLLYVKSRTLQGLAARTVALNAWGERTINFRNKPAMGRLVATSGPVSSATWVVLDVTSYVRAAGMYSFAVTTPSSTAIGFASRESGAHAPRLIITLGSPVVPTQTPTSTAMPTQTPTATPAAATATPTVDSTQAPTSTPETATPTPSNTAEAATATSTAGPTQTSTPTPTIGSSGVIQHVFVVVMENHGYTQVWNTSSSLYITQLGNAYARATNYYATGHPSLPDYLEMYAGSNYGITNDCSPSSSCHINAVNLADNLDAKGLTWKGYMEAMPAPCGIKTSGKYAPKHNPFVYFDDIRNNAARCNSHVVPFTALAADLATVATTPNYVFISPDQCSDMHDCSVSTGDTWLKNHLPAILNSPSCTAEKCLLVLTWDEDDGGQGNHVLTIFAGSAARTGGVASSVLYTHYSMLRTIEDIFGVPTQTAKDAAASPMTDLLR